MSIARGGLDFWAVLISEPRRPERPLSDSGIIHLRKRERERERDAEILMPKRGRETEERESAADYSPLSEEVAAGVRSRGL